MIPTSILEAITRCYAWKVFQGDAGVAAEPQLTPAELRLIQLVRESQVPLPKEGHRVMEVPTILADALESFLSEDTKQALQRLLKYDALGDEHAAAEDHWRATTRHHEVRTAEFRSGKISAEEFQRFLNEEAAAKERANELAKAKAEVLQCLEDDDNNWYLRQDHFIAAVEAFTASVRNGSCSKV